MKQSAPTSLADIDQRLYDLEDELATTDTDYTTTAIDAARAEANWKLHKSRILVKIANSGDKMSEDLREAKAMQTDDPTTKMSGEELYREYKLLEATERGLDRHMRAVSTRLSVYQSISKGVRSGGG